MNKEFDIKNSLIGVTPKDNNPNHTGFEFHPLDSEPLDGSLQL